ncbi:MAG: hypothetical protein HY040_06225 [Planctomycetes bacterium]|nr:hypothetical protein [Planctomycetota bacterium]
MYRRQAFVAHGFLVAATSVVVVVVVILIVPGKEAEMEVKCRPVSSRLNGTVRMAQTPPL